jgi:transposase
LHKEGYLNKEVAAKVETSEKSVSHWIQHYETKEDFSDESRSGRPALASEATRKQIKEAAEKEIFTTPRRLKSELHLDLSIRTIDRILQDQGLFGRMAKHKYPFTPKHIRKILSFLNGYSWMTEDDWEKVIYSDEKTFWGHGFCGNIYCRRPVGETLNPKYTVASIPHPVKIGCWACFSARCRLLLPVQRDDGWRAHGSYCLHSRSLLRRRSDAFPF